MISLRFAPRATAGRPAIDLGQRVVVVVDSFFFCFVSFCFFLSLASKLRRARCDHGPAAAAEATPPPIRRPRQRPIGMRRWCPASELHLSSRDRRFYLFLFLKASSWYSSLLGFYWDLFRVFLVFQLGFLLVFFFWLGTWVLFGNITVFYGFFLSLIVVLRRVPWVLLSFLDLKLGLLGFTSSSKVSFGILQGLVGFAGFYWYLKWDSLGFTEYPDFKLGFARFYKIFKSFVWDFTWCIKVEQVLHEFCSVCWLLVGLNKGLQGFTVVFWF